MPWSSSEAYLATSLPASAVSVSTRTPRRGRGGLEPAPVLADDGLLGTVVEDHQHRSQLTASLGERVVEDVVAAGPPR